LSEGVGKPALFLFGKNGWSKSVATKTNAPLRPAVQTAQTIEQQGFQKESSQRKRKKGRITPSRKSQQKTMRTGFAAHIQSIADAAEADKRVKRAHRALVRAGFLERRGEKSAVARESKIHGRARAVRNSGGGAKKLRENRAGAIGHFQKKR